MDAPRPYRKRSQQIVTAVQIDLETDGLKYRKWGDDQFARPGDWLINNDGEVYSINNDSFCETYRKVSPGRYEKQATVWAVRASENGSVKTKEGVTHYQAGDYLVSNNKDGSDRYAVAAERFHQMYEPCEDDKT